MKYKTREEFEDALKKVREAERTLPRHLFDKKFQQKFFGADLRGLDLSKLDLNGLYFIGTDFAWTDLTGANLDRTIFVCANLNGTKFTNTNITTDTMLVGKHLLASSPILNGLDLAVPDLPKAAANKVWSALTWSFSSDCIDHTPQFTPLRVVNGEISDPQQLTTSRLPTSTTTALAASKSGVFASSRSATTTPAASPQQQPQAAMPTAEATTTASSSKP